MSKRKKSREFKFKDFDVAKIKERKKEIEKMTAIWQKAGDEEIF